MDSAKKNELRYGACRCCAIQGCHRDLHKEYYINGVREVYADTFLECFNISLAMHPKNKLICSSCVDRLHDASSFREMVMTAESRLLDPLQREGCEFAQVIDFQFNPDFDIKEEVKQECSDDRDYDSDPTAEDILYDADDNQKEELEDVDEMVEGEAELLSRFSQSRLSLPRTVPLSFMRCLQQIDKDICAKDVEKILNYPETFSQRIQKHTYYLSEKKALILNISTMLENSNMTPFRSKKAKGYPCFFCRRALLNLDLLKAHINEQHEKTDLKKILWKYGPESLIVNVDITDLKCKICNQNMTNLNELKKHLTEVHMKKMCLKVSDRLVPFKLDSMSTSYECQMCSSTFETFGSIERHMNVHFRNYVCKDCGTGFATKYRLKVHIKSIHVGGSFPCDICKKVFSTYQKKKTHVDAVHKMVKRFKCPQCEEKFTEYFARQRHLVEVHNAEPIVYKCNVCDKTFVRRYALSRHMKKDHLKEKNNECEYCGYRCFTISELRVHMVRHVGDRTHECSVCKKAYARKKTLKEHMKIHSNDRRFSCAVCGQAFIQKCSLKGHVKTHHPEFTME